MSAAKTTLIDSLASLAADQGGRIAFVHPEEGPEASLTYAQLWERARSVAASVCSRTCPGDRVVISFPAGLEFVVTFFGVLASGRIAVPAPPLSPRRFLRAAQRLDSILQDCVPSLIVTQDSFVSLLRERTRVPVLAHSDRTSDTGHDVSPGRVAYLQYTSGSTCRPRGVVVTMRNLMANCRFSSTHCGFSTESVLVTWVPQYHDQGLVYGVCQPIVDGFPAVLISPERFIEDPSYWVQTISRYHATHAGGPNCTYEIALRKIPQSGRQGIDLSSWKCAYIAGEPVRHETLTAFARSFAQNGFRRDAFQPSYGLAEATLRVAASKLGSAPRVLRIAAGDLARGQIRHLTGESEPGVNVVGHGASLHANRTIIVVDPQSGSPLGENRVGELWVAGPDVADGYWNGTDESDATFGAVTNDGVGPFLRTGDLGFVNDGELYITGRLKDLIIVRALNHYPQDIEQTVEHAIPLVRPGCVAAFSLDESGEERLVVAAEVRPHPSDLEHRGHQETIVDCARIRGVLQRRLAECHDLKLHELVLLSPFSIPKTSSGKVRRQECKRQYVAGELVRWVQDGIVSGLEYKLRGGLRFSRTTGARSVSISGVTGEQHVSYEDYRGPLLEFREARTPAHVAALFSRNDEEFRRQLSRIRDYIGWGILVPSPGDGPRSEMSSRAGVSRLHRPQSKELFFAYTGLAARLMMPPIDFLTRTALIKRNVVMFRDALKDNYLSGISLDIPTIEALLTYQRGLIDGMPQLRAAYSVGTSMGAFAAMIAAHVLGLKAAWAFAPPVVRWTSRVRPDVTWDLRQLLQTSNGVTQYHIYYHADHRHDARCAGELQGLPGVRLYPQPGSDHAVVQSLWRLGRLSEIFPADDDDDAAPVGARTSLEREIDVTKVLEIVRRSVRTSVPTDWTPNSPLSDHLDSFGTIELLADLERDLAITLQLDDLHSRHLQTPASLTAFLQLQTDRRRSDH